MISPDAGAASVAAESAVMLFFAAFQLAGVPVVWNATDGRRSLRRALALLLLLNGTLTLLAVLAAEGLHPKTMDRAIDALDVATAELLLLAYLGLRREVPRVLSVGLAAAAGAHIAVTALLPEAIYDATYGWAVKLPYYAVLSALTWRAAGGTAADGWIALAFLPRGLQFAAAGVLGAARLGPSINSALAVFLAAAMAAATARLILRRSIPRTVALPVLATGLMIPLVQGTVPAAMPRAFQNLLDYATLGLVRPLFLYVAFARERLPVLAARSLSGGGTAAASAFGAIAFFQVAAPAGFLLGLAAGALVFAAQEAHGPALVMPAARPLPSEKKDPPPSGRLPHWQRILLELRGSSRLPPGRLPAAAWTQRQLARRTGIPVQRVSEFPAMMNATAAERLDAHLTGWRRNTSAPPPKLVERCEGVVEGAAGVWVYYRLTPVGDLLADALSDPTVKDG